MTSIPPGVLTLTIRLGRLDLSFFFNFSAARYFVENVFTELDIQPTFPRDLFRLMVSFRATVHVRLVLGYKTLCDERYLRYIIAEAQF